MRKYTEIISWTRRRRHLTVAVAELSNGNTWSTGPALCSRHTYGATADDAKQLDRFHEMDFNATPLCKTCARVAEGHEQ